MAPPNEKEVLRLAKASGLDAKAMRKQLEEKRAASEALKPSAQQAKSLHSKHAAPIGAVQKA